MKKYFLYYLKKNLLFLACLTLFFVVFYVVPIAMENYSRWNNGGGFSGSIQYYSRPELYTGYISTALGIASLLIPFFVFSYKMNKRSVDMHYSLPITRRKIISVHFMVGLLYLYAAYTVAYVWGFALIALKCKWLHLEYYLFLYLASLIPAFIVYAFSSFIFTRANTFIDGVVSVCGATFLITVVWNCVSRLLYDYGLCGVDILGGGYFLPFAPNQQANEYIGQAIITGKPFTWFSAENLSDFNNNGITYIMELIGGIFWLAVAIASAVGLIVSEKHVKSENCGQRSESIFCYKLQIPVYVAATSALSITVYDGLMYILVIAFAAFIAGILYKRTVKFGWKFTITLALCFIGAIIVAFPTVVN